MPKFYATFGFGQPNENRYVLIDDCPDKEAARDVMFTIWGEKWCRVYDENDWYNDGSQYPFIESLPFKISLDTSLGVEAPKTIMVKGPRGTVIELPLETYEMIFNLGVSLGSMRLKRGS